MNSEDIERAVRRRVQRFDGVYAADRLPNDPRLLVCNTDPSHKLGEHWVAIYVDEEGRYGEYFNSFGRPPPVTFRRYLNIVCIGRITAYNYRVLPVLSVDITACFIVFLEVAVLTCVILYVVLLVILVLTMCSCMDLYACNKSDEKMYIRFVIFYKQARYIKR